jgi:hypothetical protein
LMAFTKSFSSSDPIVNWFVLAPKSLIFKWWKKWVKLWKSLLSWIKNNKGASTNVTPCSNLT